MINTLEQQKEKWGDRRERERDTIKAQDNLLEGQAESIQEALLDQQKLSLINSDTVQPVPYEWNTKYLTL